MKHVHCDLIVAWASGAKIQWRTTSAMEWYETKTPGWCEGHQYRIKPEPKPDVVLYGMVRKDPDQRVAVIQHVNADSKQRATDTCKFTFDGETGKLKSAEVI